MTRTFSSKLYTVNLNLKINPWPFYKIVNGFILFKIYPFKEISTVLSLSVSLILTLVCSIDKLLEKLTQKINEVKLKNTICTMHLGCWGWEFHAKPVLLLGSISKLLARRYNLKGIRWCVDEHLASLFGLGASE